MRAVWSAPANNALQGPSNVDTVRINNTLKRQLKQMQTDLFINHQQEDAVSGGFADSIQFHFLLRADTAPMGASTSAGASFDANEGNTGSATTNFGAYENRPNFRNPGRGF